MEKKVFLCVDRTMELHECPWPTYHIETPNRLKVILDRFESTKICDHPSIEYIPSRLASKAEIGTIHTNRYIDEIESSEAMTVDEQEKLCSKYEDIYINQKTWNCAQMAAGCAIDLIEKVAENVGSCGLALVRPPGHHALPDEGCGFCIFNNVAIAAKSQSKKGKKILIVDFDVHAGQGTQECIKNDENIQLISIHRFEHGTFWPNLEQSGIKHEFENTINVPLNGIAFTDNDYFAIFSLIILPIAFEWKPDMILVSCGFDAALGDPEGFMKMTPAGYGTLIKMLKNTGLSVAAILEGGYFLDSIASDAEAVLRTMIGEEVPFVELHVRKQYLKIQFDDNRIRFENTQNNQVKKILKINGEEALLVELLISLPVNPLHRIKLDKIKPKFSTNKNTLKFVVEKLESLKNDENFRNLPIFSL